MSTAPFDPVAYTLGQILKEHDVFSRKMSERLHRGHPSPPSAPVRDERPPRTDEDKNVLRAASREQLQPAPHSHSGCMPLTFREFVDLQVVPLGRRPPAALPW